MQGGGFIDFATGDDANKLVNARPRQCPRNRTFNYWPEIFRGSFMKFRILAVGINEKVGINGDHAPCSR